MCLKLFQFQNSKLSGKTGVSTSVNVLNLKLLVTNHVFIFSPFFFPIIDLHFTNIFDDVYGLDWHLWSAWIT